MLLRVKESIEKKTEDVLVSDIIGQGYNNFILTREFYRIIKGSRMSKKSKTIALSLILNMIRYPWLNIVVFRRFFVDNRTSTFTDLQWAIKKLGKEADFKITISPMEITYKPFGTKILFRGMDNELSSTSLSVVNGVLAHAWFEEAYQIESREKFDTIVESIRGASDIEGFYKQITVSFNPWNEGHWLKQAFFDVETRVNNLFCMTTTFKVNEFIDEVDRSRMYDLYKTNPRRAKVVCDGDWGISEGLIFENGYDVVDFKPRSDLTIVRGMDFSRGGSDPSTYIAAYVDFINKEIWIYDEYYKSVNTLTLYKEVIEAKELQNKMIRADHEPERIQELNNLGANVIKAKKGAGSIAFGIQYLQGFKIHIHPKCTYFLAEISTYSWKPNKLGEYTPTPLKGEGDHLIDALRYSLSSIYMEKNYKNNSDEAATDDIVRNLSLLRP